MMMRQQSSSFSPTAASSQNIGGLNGYVFDFDEYSESLSTEVSQIIESPVQPLDVNRTTLTRSIFAAIDEQNKLRQVELEAKATHKSVERDSLERQMKQLENRRRDWEDQNGYGGYVNRDNFSVISSMSRNDSFTQGIHQNDYDSPQSRYRARILSEINSLRKELGRDAFDDVSKSIEEGLSMIRNESDNMKNELIDIDMANRWLMGQIQIFQQAPPPAASFTAKPAQLPLPMPIPVPQIQPQSQTQLQPNASLLATGFANTTTVAMSPVKKSANQQVPSSPMTKAQMKLNMFRKRREDVVREVQDDLS